MAKVLVVGGAGLVGAALRRSWEGRGAQVWAADLRRPPGPRGLRLDMQDERAVRAALAEMAPEVVAVPAANPHVDYCELHPEETRRVNVDGTLNVARACRDSGARMAFFSSDYVFDGAQGACREDDPVCPLNEYGRQKAAAEAGVLAASSRNLVIRTSTVFGWQTEPKNLVLQILRRLAAGETMHIASDILCNPTYVENLAEVTVELAERGLSGVFHVVGAQRLKRIEFARLAAETFGLDAALLLPVPSSQLTAPAPRPRDLTLLTDKVRAAVSLPLWGARAGLERMHALRGAWRDRASGGLPGRDRAGPPSV